MIKLGYTTILIGFVNAEPSNTINACYDEGHPTAYVSKSGKVTLKQHYNSE